MQHVFENMQRFANSYPVSFWGVVCIIIILGAGIPIYLEERRTKREESERQQLVNDIEKRKSRIE